MIAKFPNVISPSIKSLSSLTDGHLIVEHLGGSLRCAWVTLYRAAAGPRDGASARAVSARSGCDRCREVKKKVQWLRPVPLTRPPAIKERSLAEAVSSAIPHQTTSRPRPPKHSIRQAPPCSTSNTPSSKTRSPPTADAAAPYPPIRGADRDRTRTAATHPAQPQPPRQEGAGRRRGSRRT